MRASENMIPVLNAIFTRDSFVIEALHAEEDTSVKARKLAFDEAPDQALFELGFGERPQSASPSFGWLYLLSSEFLRALTNLPGLEISREKTRVEPDQETLNKLLYSVPFGLGTEYLDEAWIRGIFARLSEVFCRSIAEYSGSVSLFLAEKSQELHVPERIFFHVVESKDSDAPFAFLATYATKMPDQSVRHMPLSYALEEFKGHRDKLLSLLSCLNGAAQACPLIGSFVESGELFHPLWLSSQEAYEILKAVPDIERTGILCRVPAWWKKKAASVALQVTLGEERPSYLGFDGILSMRPSLVVDGVELTQKDIETMLRQAEGLALLKGKWVEVDHGRLQELLQKMEDYEGNLSLMDALRMEAGMKDQTKPNIDVGPLVTNGKWLGELLHHLRQPASMEQREVPKSVHASLRPYQETGFSWLDYMSGLGFGACLADDMGLGKTLQVLTFLQKQYDQNPDARFLLIVPASLLGNWEKEASRFTPELPFLILHGQSAGSLEEMAASTPVFLTITTYGMAVKMKRLQEVEWTCVILDEAQAIKNPGTQQTRTIKKLKSQYRIAMTGTPIENELANLWSLFDFLNKGLLGTSTEFSKFAKELERNSEGYQKLKNMVSPFILRRLKTDKRIISDLPEKMEQLDYVKLSRKQTALYRQQVDQLAKQLAELDGMQRRGLILAYITRLKQICNHPDQYLGQNAYAPDQSGKFGLLHEICSTIYEKRERVLIFTQYREITDALERYLETIFGQKGLVLHGGTPVKKRAEMVEKFNGKEYVPFMVLSVKAGGTGLNLTAANHVIHFDRWWNPAVENQATDRAYRIGQNKNVIVHKLISEGTIEEKIDAMIHSKKDLAENVIGASGEGWITELGNEDLLKLMRLDA